MTAEFPAPPPSARIRSLADVVRVNAAEWPDAVALECEGERLTFAELRDRAASVAAALVAEGVGPGSRVAVVARNGTPFFELLFGTAMCDAVFVPVNWRLADDELAQVVDHSEATVVVIAREFAPALERVAARLRHVRRIVVLGRHSLWPAYEAWMGDHQAHDPGLVAGRDDVALQLYTSGTTGRPKGVMLTNGNVFTKVHGVNRWWQFDPADSVVLLANPAFHVAGLGWAVGSLAYGCATVVLPDPRPEAIVESIRGGVTHAHLVPALIRAVLGVPGVSSADFASLRKLVYGASPISASVLAQAIDVIGCEMIQAYGLTETVGAVTQLDPADHDPVAKPGLLHSCGRRYPWVELRIVGEHGVDAGEGEIGEVWVRSPQVMAGYWRDPEATAAAVTPSGWFKTGDVGLRDGAGYVYLYDRITDMIVTGGENVFPGEVENVLMDHPAVADAAVFGVPDERWGETVKAVVVPAGDAHLEPGALIAHCRERLAHYKCPTSVDVMAELPRNASGKLLRRELRAPHWEAAGRFVG